MSERFRNINETDYSSIMYRGFPVILQKSRITYDSQNSKIVIQIKLCNISSEIVDTVYISVDCYDVSGQHILSVGEHIMSLLDAEHGESFGDKSPVYADDPRIASVGILINKVVFKNGTVWENTERSVGEQAEPKREFDFSGNIRTQFAEEARPDIKSECMFEEFNTYWRCSCGMLNQAEDSVCALCSANIEKLRICFDTSYLSQRYEEEETKRKNNIYDSAIKLIADDNIENLEKALKSFKSIKGWNDSDIKAAEIGKRIEEIKSARKRAEQEARAVREMAEKKRKKKITAIALTVFGTTILSLLTVFVIVPAIRYSGAENMLNKGQYDDAIAVFSDLENYKDSAQRIPEVKYAKAENFFDLGSFEDAIPIYTELGDYSDSADKIKQSYIGMANRSFDNKDYISAMEAMEIADPENIEFFDDCLLKYAEDAIESNNYAQALTALEGVRKSDCSEMLKKTRYTYGLQLIEREKYSDAQKQLKNLNYNDSDYYFKYADGMVSAAEGNYGQAVKSMSDCGGILDSNKKLDEFMEALYVNCSESIEKKDYTDLLPNLEVLSEHNYKDSSAKCKKIQKIYDSISGKYVYVSGNASTLDRNTFVNVQVNKSNNTIHIDFYARGDKYDFQRDNVEKMSGPFKGYAQYSGFEASKYQKDLIRELGYDEVYANAYVDYITIKEDGELICKYIGDNATFKKQ